MLSLIVSGGISGIAGAGLVLGGETEVMAEGFAASYNLEGIVVALLALTVHLLTAPSSARACGTGFFVTDDGYVLTTWRLVVNAGAIWVVSPHGNPANARLAAGVADRDIILTRKDSPRRCPIESVNIVGARLLLRRTT